ncbi:hypothetical protein [Bauldia sp.]|uniref:hypothetical protein n=1 Tax=Bauldia sp. TaxID=2575872 RepID=UPI003BA92842
MRLINVLCLSTAMGLASVAAFAAAQDSQAAAEEALDAYLEYAALYHENEPSMEDVRPFIHYPFIYLTDGERHVVTSDEELADGIDLYHETLRGMDWTESALIDGAFAVPLNTNSALITAEWEHRIDDGFLGDCAVYGYRHVMTKHAGTWQLTLTAFSGCVEPP